MAKNGPIIYVEDDLDDQELFTEALAQLAVDNKIEILPNGTVALNYLKSTADQPFLIFCDINMPQKNGIELRDEINNDPFLKEKSIPFVFFTTSASKEAVKQAYLMNVQGFFVKPQNFAQLKTTLQEVINYWMNCKHPNLMEY